MDELVSMTAGILTKALHYQLLEELGMKESSWRTINNLNLKNKYKLVP